MFLCVYWFWYIWRLQNKSNIEICFFAYIYILYIWRLRINQILKYVSLRIFTFWYIWRIFWNMFLCVCLLFGIFDVCRIKSNIEICFFAFIYIVVYLTSIEYLHFGIFDVYQILKYVSLRIFTFWYIWRL